MSKPRPLLSPFLTRTLVTVVLSAVLTACGGSGSPETAEGRATSADAGGAVLNSAELASAEKAAVAADASASLTPLDELPAGQIAAKSAYTSGAVARKALATRIPVYRFYNNATGAHFFTTDTTERDNIVATLSPPFSLEGAAFSVASAFSPGLSPVHRFYNTQTGVHFYTITESERASVVANLPHFTYEGVAYHASQVAGAGLIPFYRFFVPSKGFHFYTANEGEKDSIIANLAATYSFEGIGYYVLDTNWRAEKLPHSGIPVGSCYQAGGNELVKCTTSGTSSLNPQQDGHRVAINTMSFSTVGSNPLTSCVKDNVTGLVWEGKTASGTRAGSNTYTNQGGGATTDTSGYVATVNFLKLCGFTDWRLPTRLELQGLVDYGISSGNMVNGSSFPNTASDNYWVADLQSDNDTRAWRVAFSDMGGHAGTSPRSTTYPVRLVRGSAPSGTRFTFSTIADDRDAANNVVNDAWTGLQWRRCEERRVWNGSACTGTESAFTHEQALAHARLRTGWRLPNAKELASLTDLSVTSGTRIDPVAFPGASGNPFWSSSARLGDPANAWVVSFGNSFVGTSARTVTISVRLVRTNP